MNFPSGPLPATTAPADFAEHIRVYGTVQGVGFRPTVWRLARQYGIRGWVANDGDGVSILACGSAASVSAFVMALPGQAPPLARIESIERRSTQDFSTENDFRIIASHAGHAHTNVAADAATCPACLAEILDPQARRFRYPFTNCTHCGPRLSIIESIPYDRASTTMRKFELCAACATEYADPEDRRFHAQPVACPVCGPHTWLERADGALIPPLSLQAVDSIDAVCTLIRRGHIVAIKGLGGFQLACDASNNQAVARLRERKQRQRKPFALMARDLEVVRRYCHLSDAEAALLQSPTAPIIILDTSGNTRLASGVAPGQTTLGFMLPNTPLHHLVMQRLDVPMVLTSGNLGEEPQCIDNKEARARLWNIAEYFLMHDRDIARRVDDSVMRVIAGAPQTIRRARGYAPEPISLPAGFASAESVLSMGGELKNTFCLLRDGKVIISHHMGDLGNALCHSDYRQSIAQYLQLFEHTPQHIAVDMHPEYLSRKLGMSLAEERQLPCLEIQHHHAHIAACLAENGVAIDASPVLGVALDGLGYGADGALWGGEFLVADYRGFRRTGSFKAVAMPGGERAVYEPWRNTYAQLLAAMGWERFAARHDDLELYRFFLAKPHEQLARMIRQGINSPRASSCGRLFDAVAAAAGICRDQALYEGQAAVELEAMVDGKTLQQITDSATAYPFDISPPNASDLPCIDPAPMWHAVLEDLKQRTPKPLIAARFHLGLARAIVRMVQMLSMEAGNPLKDKIVALSGGVFQNRTLLQQLTQQLEAKGFRVLAHHRVPTNDGGLALGQAVIAAARSLAQRGHHEARHDEDMQENHSALL